MTTAISKAADAAWERYRSCVQTGGTPAQRQWAFDAAMRAERKHWATDRAATKAQQHAENKTKAESVR